MKKELPTYVVVAIFAGIILTLVSVRYRTPPIVVDNPPALSCPTAGVNGPNPTEPGSLTRGGRGFPYQFIEIESCYGEKKYSINPVLLFLDIGFYMALIIGFRHFMRLAVPKQVDESRKKRGNL